MEWAWVEVVAFRRVGMLETPDHARITRFAAREGPQGAPRIDLR